MRVLFWCTSFQSDNLALALHLESRPDVEVRVLVDGAEACAADQAGSPAPYGGFLGERGDPRVVGQARDWAPDLVIVDNHLPRQRLAPKLLVLWHGYGWRVDDLRQMKKELASLIGDTEQPNPDFCWQAFGPIDQRYRIAHSGFHGDNVVALGSAFSDLALPSAPRGARLLEAPRAALGNLDPSRKTALIGFTWHHGAPFDHWGDNDAVFERLLAHLSSRGVNAVVRMHDRHRYPKAELRRLDALAASHPNLLLRFKDQAPNSLPDLLTSDVLISNYSSLLNDYYYTLKPSIHVDPRQSDGSGRYRYRRFGRVWTRREKDAASTWKSSPDDVGGLIAKSPDDLLEQLDRALSEPNCCRELAEAYLTRHIAQPDGSTCERIARFALDWVATGRKPVQGGTESTPATGG